MTVYENLQDMLRLAEELRDTFKAQGNDYRANLYANKVEQHKAELAKFDQTGGR
jgi:hypothetical protein